MWSRFIKFFIFNCLMSNISLFNFNCLTSDFCFPQNISSASRREWLFMDARPKFWVLNSPGRMVTCYLRGENKFLRYHTLCMIILKCGFPTKDIERTHLVLFEVPKIPQLWVTAVWTSFDLFILLSLVSDGDARLDFSFPFTLPHPVSATLSVLV